jgi:hypothetical protein
VSGNLWGNAAWREYCELYAAMVRERGAARVVLNLSPGWGPNSAQRRALTLDYRQAHRIDDIRRFALLTDSQLVRGIVTALSWLATGTQTAAYAPSRAVDAVAWLRQVIAFDVADAVAVFGELMDGIGHSRRLLPAAFWALTDADLTRKSA